MRGGLVWGLLRIGLLPYCCSNGPVPLNETFEATLDLVRLGNADDVSQESKHGGIFMVASCTDGYGFMDAVSLDLTKIPMSATESPSWFAFSDGVFVSDLNKIVLVPMTASNFRNPQVRILDVWTWKAVDVELSPLQSGYHGGAVTGNGTVHFTPGGSQVCPNKDGFIDFWEIISFDVIAQKVLDEKTRIPEWDTCFGRAVAVPDGRIILVPWFVRAATHPSVGLFLPEAQKVSPVVVNRQLDHEAYWFHHAVLTPDGQLVFTPLDVDFIGVLHLHNDTFTTVNITEQFPFGMLRKFGGGAYAAATDEVIMAPLNAMAIGVFNMKTFSFTTIPLETGSCSFLAAAATPSGQIIFAPWQCPIYVAFDPVARSIEISRMSDDQFHRDGWDQEQGYFSGAFVLPPVAVPHVPASPRKVLEMVLACVAFSAAALAVAAIFYYQRFCKKTPAARPAALLGGMSAHDDIQVAPTQSRPWQKVSIRNLSSQTQRPSITWETRLHQVRKCVQEEHVTALFEATGRGQFEIVRVEMVEHSAQQLRECSDMLKTLDQQKGDRLRGGAFGLGWDQELDDEDRRSKMELLDYLSTQFMIAPWASLLDSRAGSVLVAPVWLGAGEGTIEQIAAEGFAGLDHGARLTQDNLADPGWFGKGRYNSIEASLSCRNACTIAEGAEVVLLSLAVVGCAYPITPGRIDFQHGPLPPEDPKQCMYHGATFREPCDTHIVGVDQDTMQCTAPGLAHYHKVVSAHDAQLLPLAKVFFQVSDRFSASPPRRS